MCTRRMPVHICVNISIPATRDHLPRGDTLAGNRQCPLVAGTTVMFNVISGTRGWMEVQCLNDPYVYDVKWMILNVLFGVLVFGCVI